MKVRNRILLLSSLLLLVSVGGIGNIVWQLPHVEQMQDLKAVLHCLILLGLFGVGLIFSVLELVRQEIMNPIFQLAAQVVRLKEREIDGHRLELTGSKDIDLLTSAFNDLLDGFEKEEHLYRIFAEASPDMIFLLDRDGRVLFGNLNAARQWNYQAEEIIGKRQEELFPPDIAERHKQVIQKIFETGLPVFVEVHEKIGERHCWVDAHMMPVINEDGRVSAVLGISRDITERKRAEESIKQSVEEWQRTFDSIPDFILILDNDNIITKANFRFAEAFNLRPEELIGKKCHEIFHKSDKPCPDCPYELTKKDKLLHSAEIDDPNIKIPLLVTTAPIFNDKNEIIGAIHVAKDISDLKKTEDALRESNAYLENLFNYANAPIIVWDPQFRITRFNHAFESLTGLAAGEVLGQTLDLLFPPAQVQRTMEFIRKTSKGERWETVEIEILHRDGTVRTVLWNSATLFDPDKKTPIATIAQGHDITKRKWAEEALQESEARYKALFVGAAEGILVADLQTKQFRYANPAVCRMFGYTEEEFTRLGVTDIHPKESLNHVMTEFEAQVRGEKTLASDLPCLRKDGALFYANICGIKITLDGRECNVGFFTDITERKRMEEEKHLMEERSRKVVEDIFRFIPEGVLVFSRKIELLRQNQAFQDLVSGSARRLGFTEDELGNLIIDKIKAGLRDDNIKEIRIARKHETGK